ncbi:MAG TPA: hypothetical protein VEG60_00915, partial [Candidatus Binatia bacterium]|nr:hypothetical protein [Candidatus Binatia bacterium]
MPSSGARLPGAIDQEEQPLTVRELSDERSFVCDISQSADISCARSGSAGREVEPETGAGLRQGLLR